MTHSTAGNLELRGSRALAAGYPTPVRYHAIMAGQVELGRSWIADFCRRRRISEFALFGSVVNGDFHAESDVDVLLAFRDDARWRLLDVVEKSAIRNPYRRRHILANY